MFVGKCPIAFFELGKSAFDKKITRKRTFLF